jgi:hypothetical protein
MSPVLRHARITAVQPLWAIHGGRITILGNDFPIDGNGLPEVRIGDAPARVVHASSRALSVIVPPGADAGRAAIRIEGLPGETAYVEVGAPIATGLHQVDNPVFDRAGNLYLTFSGTRGQQVPVSIFRVGPSGVREPFVSGITNPTSMAFDRYDRLHVSSRFEGTIYRVGPDGSTEIAATDLGVSCGLAFDLQDNMYVGDRSGTIFRVRADGDAKAVASLPASIAAFHLAMSREPALYVAGPTLSPRDSVYRVDFDGSLSVVHAGFGRPQGLAVDSSGHLYVVEALAGVSGLYRVRDDGSAEHVLAGPGLVGVALDPTGGLVVTSNDTAYRFEVPLRPPT